MNSLTAAHPVQDPDAPRPEPPAGQRWRTAFHWTRVDEDLLRDLLEAANVGQQEVERLGQLGTEQLAHVAENKLGARLNDRSMNRLAPVLQQKWLPKADDVYLEELTLVTQSSLSRVWRDRRFSTREERIEFLLSRPRTRNFRVNLMKAFHHAHRGVWLVDAAETTPLQLETPRHLRGEALARLYPPFAHAEDAWDVLDERHRNEAGLRGLIVLPTGAGKTDIAVEWALRRLRSEPELRILWIAHQVFLLEQAAEAFVNRGREQPGDLDRTLRIFASGGSPLTQLNRSDPSTAGKSAGNQGKTDVALATIQTLTTGYGRNRRKGKRIERFLEGPTLVVVDEAHHATAPGYQRLLQPAPEEVLGLTATPWPATEQAKEKLEETFPTTVVEKSREELIRAGVLCPYEYVTVETGWTIPLDERERRDAIRLGDFSSATLRRIEDAQRNELVVETWRQRRDQLGRTLVFTSSKENAERLTYLLQEAGAEAEFLHSTSGRSLAKLKPWFEADEQAVLVSVGMLLEGVDLPPAKTALVARPTRSPRVLTQMIGRVLRRWEGKDTAYVVYLVDDFPDLPGSAEPEMILPSGSMLKRREARFPQDVAAAVEELLAELDEPEDADESPGDEEIEEEEEKEGDDAELPGDEMEEEDDDERGEGPAERPQVRLEQRRLVGYYSVLDGAVVPVFDHQAEVLEEYVELRRSGEEEAALASLEDVPPPGPSPKHLDLLDECVALEGHVVFHALDHEVAPVRCARLLEGGGQRTEQERREVIRGVYEDPFVRAQFGSQELFAEAVHRAQINLSQGRVQHPERVEQDDRPRPPMPYAERDLGPILDHVMIQAETLLPSSRRMRLERPALRWTTAVRRGALAYFKEGSRPGEGLITVNLFLAAPPEDVPDDVLAFLLWHELLHGILRGQAHDAEFYELESRWPTALECDATLDHLEEVWSMDKAKYAGRPVPPIGTGGNITPPEG